MGVYNKDDGIGYGRVMPIENIHTIKLLFKTGFELFLKDPPFESWLFAVTEGGDEVISLCKSLADAAGTNRKRAVEGILHSGDLIKYSRSADRKRF